MTRGGGRVDGGRSCLSSSMRGQNERSRFVHSCRAHFLHHQRRLCDATARQKKRTKVALRSNINTDERRNIEEYHHGHVSVLLREVLEAFKPVAMQTHVDGTVGAGGHASEIVAQRKGEMKTFVGFDVDQSAIEIAKPRIEKCLNMNERGDANGVKVHFVQNNFDQMRAALEDIGVRGADSILLDLGVSSMHLDRAERGFSFQNDGPLDMRMSCVSNGTSSSSSSSSSSSLPSLTAFDVVNGWSEEDLGRIFRDYGGERHWKLLAKRVCERRMEKPIETTLELVKALGNPPGKREKIHPATRAFQAVRIATNDELGVIERVIPQAIEILNPGGRLAIITFHSLEDAIVKKQFRKFAGVPESREPTVGGSAMMSVSPDDINQSNPPKIVKMINRKPISATDEEIKVNARSRSAKLRVVEKL